MKILLLYLPKNPDNIRDYEQIIQPIGIAYVAGYLKSKGFDVTLLDAQAYKMSRFKIENFIDKIKPDIIGFSTMTYNLPVAASFLPYIKSRHPQTMIVFGGSHVSVEPESTLKRYPEIDFVVIGEGEITMHELCLAIKSKSPIEEVKGIGYRHNDKIVINEKRDYIENLDNLPYPDWESLPMENYWDADTTKKNYVRFFASRGCVFSCTFCSIPAVLGRKIRKRSPENIIHELSYLYEKHGVREVLFGDSTFNVDNHWVQEICHGIINKNLSINWRCCVRAGLLDKETLILMKKAGCVGVSLGIESADDQMLKAMKKGQTLDQIKKGILLLKEVNMPSEQGYIIGMPDDTVESIQKSIRFAKKVSAGNTWFYLATPLPGSEFYEQAKREGFALDDWEKIHSYDISYIPKYMSKNDLQLCYRKAVREFYFRPSYLIRRLLKIKSFFSLMIHLRYALRIIQRALYIG